MYKRIVLLFFNICIISGLIVDILTNRNEYYILLSKIMFKVRNIISLFTVNAS